MYLIGIFEREDYSWQADSKLSEVKIVEKAKTEHLVKAREDENYQVINLITREYFDPKLNAWVKIECE